MRSSENTRNRQRDRSLRLWLIVLGDDHPKACTGRRLIARGRVTEISPRFRRHPSPVILDPFARDPISGRDRPAARGGGILAVDCSWNRLSERSELGLSFEEEGSRSRPIRRRLPFLIATNPQHYGRVGQLNTVEALSAAVALLGPVTEARGLLEGFHGGERFLVENEARFGRYRACASPEEIRLAERELFLPKPEQGLSRPS